MSYPSIPEPDEKYPEDDIETVEEPHEDEEESNENEMIQGLEVDSAVEHYQLTGLY